MEYDATPPQGGLAQEDEGHTLADGPATDDILLKGLTRSELDQIEAAAFRDGYGNTSEWCRDIIFAIARLN